MSVTVIAKRKLNRKSNRRGLKKQVSLAVKRLGETKFYSTQLVSQGSTAGEITQLAPLDQGAANGERVGLSIEHMYLKFRYIVQTTASSPQICRVIIFKYNDNYLSAPNIGQLLTNDTGGANPSVMAPYNLIYKDKYKVLHDKTYHLSGYNVAATTYNTVDTITRASKSIKLKGTYKWVDDQGIHYEKGTLFLAVISTSSSMDVPDFSYQYIYKDN